MIIHIVAARAAVILAAGPNAAPTNNPTVPRPTIGDAPATESLTRLINALATYAIYAAVAAVLIGGIAWALGERMGLDRASMVGKSGVIAGMGLAFLVGSAAAFVSFFLATGGAATDGTPAKGLDRPAVVHTVDAVPGADRTAHVVS
jgi:hypothetical protein